MKITLLKDRFDSSYSDKQDISNFVQEVVVIPNDIYDKLTNLYRTAGNNVDNGFHGLPNPLSILTGEDLELVQKETDLYKKRRQINALKDEQSQLGLNQDITGLLSVSFVELLYTIKISTDFEDLKSKIANTMLQDLADKFNEVNPELPPVVKGVEQTAEDFLRYQNDVAQLFKGEV